MDKIDFLPFLLHLSSAQILQLCVLKTKYAQIMQIADHKLPLVPRNILICHLIIKLQPRQAKS